MKNGREENQKRYLTSRGLYKPIELENVDILKYMSENHLTVKSLTQFENEYIGNITYAIITKM